MCERNLRRQQWQRAVGQELDLQRSRARAQAFNDRTVALVVLGRRVEGHVLGRRVTERELERDIQRLRVERVPDAVGTLYVQRRVIEDEHAGVGRGGQQ